MCSASATFRSVPGRISPPNGNYRSWPDSAAGFNSAYADGERVGGRGVCEIFSFDATKPFAVGEGGALASRNPRLVEQTHDFQDFGFAGSDECTQLEMNGRLQEISAAIGLR